MRKVILGAGISLDGYIARPSGAVDFLFMPPGVRKAMVEFFSTIDTAIFGRKTLDAAVRISGGAYQSPVPLTTYVFSRSRPPGEREGVIFVNQAPARFIRQLRKRPGKNIYLMGGGELAREFLRADLVDELHLGVVPVLLGEGIPFFPSVFPQREFALIENKTSPKGLISLKYRRAAGGRTPARAPGTPRPGRLR